MCRHVCRADRDADVKTSDSAVVTARTLSSTAAVVVATQRLVRMHGQRAVNCTAVAVWSKVAVTSSRSPKGSQKVTARPCISTPHCSPTSQLVHSDLRGEETELEHKQEVSRERTEDLENKWTLWITRRVVTFSPTRCSGPALLVGSSQSRHAAQRVFHGAPLHQHTICSQLATACVIPCL